MKLNEIRFNQIATFSLVLIAFTIPFWMLFNNIAIIVAFVLSLINLVLYKMEFRVWYKEYSIFIFIYLLMVVALLYTDNLKLGFVRLEQRIPYLILPLVFYSFSSFLDKQLIFKIIRSFTLAVVLVSLIFIVNAVRNTLYFGSMNPFNETNGNFFSYMLFTEIIEDTHPIYFGCYVLLSLFTLANDYFTEDKIYKLNSVLKGLIIFFLIVITFLLNSFLLAGLIIVFFLYFTFLMFKKGKLSLSKKIIFVCFAIITIVSSSGFVLNKLKGVNIKEDIVNHDFSGTKFTAVRARVAKAYSSIDLIGDNFWLGVGPGDERLELLKYYDKNSFHHGIDRNFNSHNQFLTEFIFTGVFGFLGLVILFYLTFKRGFKSSNNYLIGFSLICFCFCLTESALIRNKGIVFFVFFACLLLNLVETTRENFKR